MLVQLRTLAPIATLLLLLATAVAAQDPAALTLEKTQREIQKLNLEIDALKRSQDDWPAWLPVVLGLAIAVIGTGASLWVARRTRIGALDQAVHQKRIETYGSLVETTAPLALYFPPVASLSPQDCREIGVAMRSWYFKGGGILMSKEARDVYFALATALSRAAKAEALNVPKFPDDAAQVSDGLVDKYREELAPDLSKSDWVFGRDEAASESVARKFRDYIFLQTLCSNLRTELSTDLRSRRRTG